MGQDQEVKHVCKFCNKIFPCGRSLGGHKRSHLINQKHTKKKQLHSIKNGDFTEAVYVLRENPKKTSKVAESSEDTLLTNDQKRICKKCGKSFLSWKALFGHMKCHSTRISSRNSVEEDSWNSQSDNKKKRSSSTGMKSYMAATISSTLSVTTNNSEQEEVAMSLIMLSRDVGNWVALNPVTECFDANSHFLQTRSSSQSHIPTDKNKSSNCMDGEFLKLNKAEQGESNRSHIRESGIPRNVCKMDEKEVPTDKFRGDDKEKETIADNEYKKEVEFLNMSVKLVKLEMNSDQKENSSKKRSFEKNVFYSEQKIKFECTTCNKTFHSYQALGGHKARYKKLKGCENSTIGIVHLQNQAADSKLIKNCSNDITIDESGGKVRENYVIKKLNRHECPICFKFFQSGQALGGHKRSHLIAEAKNNSIRAEEIQKPIPEIRGFLDLNLPAPVEEESSEHIEFHPWWIGSSYTHEQQVGLLS